MTKVVKVAKALRAGSGLMEFLFLNLKIARNCCHGGLAVQSVRFLVLAHLVNFKSIKI